MWYPFDMIWVRAPKKLTCGPVGYGDQNMGHPIHMSFGLDGDSPGSTCYNLVDKKHGAVNHQQFVIFFHLHHSQSIHF